MPLPSGSTWRFGAVASAPGEGTPPAREPRPRAPRPPGRGRGDGRVAHGKRYRAAREHVKEGFKYGIDEAVELVKKTASAKFDESVDVAFRLGVNPKQPNHMVRGSLLLPHSSGKTVRVVVFAEGDAAREAQEAGADFVGA